MTDYTKPLDDARLETAATIAVVVMECNVKLARECVNEDHNYAGRILAEARRQAGADALAASHEPEREGPDFLDWVADRLIRYGDSPNIDFIHCLRRRAEKARAALAAYERIAK